MRPYRQIGSAILLLAGSAAAHAGTVTVYSALESDEIAVYLDAAKQALPDIDIHVLRLSSGDLAARLLAESAQPRNDAIWGMAVTDMLEPRIAALLTPVRGTHINRMPSAFRAADGRWFAPTGFLAALCVNREALAEHGLPMPRTWTDLASPRYRGQVAMPDPASSGTGYMLLSSLSDAGRDPKGMQVVLDIARNVGQVTLSGSAPCKLARIGEFPIGISFAFSAMQSIRQGYPVSMVIPEGARGYELEASGLMAKASNPGDARRFLDWTASPEAAVLYRGYKEIVAAPGSVPSAEQQREGLPADLVATLPARDFATAARERAALIARYKRLTR
ncbi:iron(III) transport system substrate-binding protein [Luteibacter sp. UNC138MFCol5.1]|uniref:extracellular solute-binding protein n=1 Tax=Luteibacter sp. UNC138MFCol5.1 TaxID=1502774 RepID=UPI0008D4063D|nr:extracellular solute-binding protein [Luteibacter sp. UNC138MFCol5.1]SEO56953.1 iron(III) transport system substrate-binding protein [Luteibacter sp. UNC138MFCol5.1]